MAGMRLKHGRLANDVEVVLSCLGLIGRARQRGLGNLVDAEGHQVRFEGFFVVVLALLYEGPDVPAYVRLEVFAHAVLDECYPCIALAKVDHDEALHAQGFCAALDKAW